LTPYARAQRIGRDAVRRAVLDAASRLLVEEGPQALAMRRVAAAAGCSTSVLYGLFGGKEGLTDALYQEGFARLAAAIESAVAAVEAAGGGAIAAAVAAARAYRANALAERNYYGVMFGNPIPGFAPSAASLAVAEASIAPLVEAIRAAMDAGVLVAGDPREVAEVCWAAAHGVVSLELAGHLPDPAVATARFRTLCWAAIGPFLADPGAMPRLGRPGGPGATSADGER
jgi:AcrR family transcriptional regulator